MEIGRCPRCSRAYSVSDVAGFGILRARAARDGGPRLEYTCPDCACIVQLIPHGEGRYGPPGEPPPPAPPPEARRPPWLKDAPEPEPAPQAPPRTAAPPPPAFVPPPEPEPLPPAPAVDLDAPLDMPQALALLGCSPTAGPREIERAFNARSRTCHPDKVAHLDAEFQELAEKKFKRLLAAKTLLLG